MNNAEDSLIEMGEEAKKAFLETAKASASQKDYALNCLAALLEKDKDKILAANQKDVAAAKAAGLSEAMIDRLSLTGRMDRIIQDVYDVASLPDPVGQVFETKQLDNGLTLSKKRTPIGVLGVIYEARPNVTIDISTVTIKTGNTAILRGGSETLQTNQVLVQVIQNALAEAGLPLKAIQLIASPDRKLVNDLLKMHEYVDLIIPRGGASLHQFCRENSTIPVITGGVGICHLFVDADADLSKALAVIDNAKTQRPTVCNALDTLLVHQNVASTFIPQLIEKLALKGVSFRLDPKAMKTAGSLSAQAKNSLQLAGPDDWDIEWLSLVLGIRVVDNLDEAIEHVQQHSSGHSDGILTEQPENARRFVDEVDSAVVYVNASTRFTDASQFGMGAEVIISTQKIHARGPMGLQELTSYKWVVQGDYHVRP